MPFEQRRLERRRDNEPLDVAGNSSWHSQLGSGVWHGYVLFDYRPSRSQIGFTICRNRNHGFFPHVRQRADADLGRLGDLVQLLAGRVKQEWTALVLFRIALNADSVRRYLFSLIKPINRLQTEAAITGERLNNGRELQASWDRSVMIRVPLLVVSLLAQCFVLLVASA